MSETEQTESVSVEKVKELAAKLWRARELRDEKAEEAKVYADEYRALEETMLKVLDACELERFDSEHCTISVASRSSVRVPKTREDKEAFFSYLRARGVYDDLVTVNSQTLNAYYREEEEKAVAEGAIEFSIPGLSATPYQTLQVRKRK